MITLGLQISFYHKDGDMFSRNVGWLGTPIPAFIQDFLTHTFNFHVDEIIWNH